MHESLISQKNIDFIRQTLELFGALWSAIASSRCTLAKNGDNADIFPNAITGKSCYIHYFLT
jgi:hypothetical protein